MTSSQPVAVFDTGLGSFSIVQKIVRTFPKQDLVYLADRASFPYGGKTIPELYQIVSATIKFLEKNYSPTAIVVASNAPSVTVLPDLRKKFDTPLFGIRPPVAEACRRSKTKEVGILGVSSLIESKELQEYIEAQRDSAVQVRAFNASALVELVEDGTFLRDAEKTLKLVKSFVRRILEEYPEIDVFTLSSTHLPWLENFFRQSFTNLTYVDPADDMVAQLKLPNNGSGKISGLLTIPASGDLSQAEFQTTLDRLDIKLSLDVVNIPQHTK